MCINGSKNAFSAPCDAYIERKSASVTPPAAAAADAVLVLAAAAAAAVAVESF
eukprot:COSAG06_NODE_3088_length_5874_cov_3.759391_4_plen_53_part_00